MIIDDDAAAVENLTAMLEAHGYEVCAFDTIDGAIGVIEKTKPDLLILDVMFPSNPAGGFDLARTVRQTRAVKKLPIILLTSINDEFPMGFSSHDMDPEWMPVQAFIEKPVSIAALVVKIKSLLESPGKA
jgi:DNA-binding response OmpR family regulator